KNLSRRVEKNFEKNSNFFRKKFANDLTKITVYGIFPTNDHNVLFKLEFKNWKEVSLSYGR
ncbi:hypothetical protein KAX00_03280, partial [bacterium]|nr:hypothetical protein [bacterium]